MTGNGGALEHYVSSFRGRVLAMQAAGRELIDQPGILGAVGDAALRDGRVLITDDRALDLLVARLPDLSARLFLVLAAAEKCRAHLDGAGGFHGEPATAMVLDDLRTVGDLPLPAGLSLHHVAAADDAEGVPLARAAATALAADPDMTPDTDLGGFVTFLRGIPGARFLAAVDEGGTVRATAGSTVYGDDAGVFFVSTDEPWRRRGVGTAMTAAALRSAAERGARRACLDSSELGLPIYRRLGFSEVSPLTLFVQSG